MRSPEKPRRVLTGRCLFRVTYAKREGSEGPPPDLADTYLTADRPDSGGGLRREIEGASRQSLARLSEVMATFRYGGPSCHLTLTFGPDFPETREGVVAAQRRFSMAFRRLGLWGLWRLEFQRPRRVEDPESRAAHWHCLLYHSGDPLAAGAAFEAAAALWRAWQGGSKFSAKITRSDALASWYIAAHTAKSVIQGRWPAWFRGRAWGYIDRAEYVGHCSLVEGPTLDRGELYRLARLYRRHLWARSRVRHRAALAAYGRGERSTRPRLRKSRSSGLDGFRWFLPASEHERVLSWLGVPDQPF